METNPQKLDAELQDLLNRRELARRRVVACQRSWEKAKQKRLTRKYQAKGDLPLEEAEKLRSEIIREHEAMNDAQQDVTILDKLIFRKKREIQDIERQRINDTGRFTKYRALPDKAGVMDFRF